MNKIIFKPKTDNTTQELQSAIDKAAASGAELIIPAGIYVCGTLFMRSGLTITLERGAYILGSERFEDYSDKVNLFTDAVDNKRGRSLIYADGIENLTIRGEGAIDGRGELFSETHPHHLERPFLVRIMNSKNLSFSGIQLKKSAAWTLHLQNCENIDIKNLFINSRVNGNNDGIDIDSCRSCRIEGCFIDTGDDAICLKSTVDKPCSNVAVTGCVITTNWAGFKVGTESVGDFENITFTNSYIYDCNGCAIKLCPVDGGNLKNLTISNIQLNNATGPIFIAGGDRLREYQPGNSRCTAGAISDILIENISGKCINAIGTTYKGEAWGNAKSCICISGTKDNKVQNLTVRNITLEMAGGVNEYTYHEIPEMGKRYPEFHNFGVLPAWGLFVRNAENFIYTDVNMTCTAADVRDEVWFDDEHSGS